MTISKRILLLLLLLCNGLCFYAYGQKPIITPKSNPILPLDDNGYYKILPEDVASYSNYNPDSPLVVNFNPESVDCTTLGNQSIGVKALTNGADPGNASVFAVGFNGNFITGIAYDSHGNLYVTEDLSFSIRKITPEGDVTVFAGTGYRGTTNGPANTAQFGSLNGIIIDSKDNIYVSDTYFNIIRKITPEGMVSTLTGTGFKGHKDGQGTNASFFEPAGLDIDAADNIYVADSGNGLVRKITPDGVVTTIANVHGWLWCVAVGPDGYIYWVIRTADARDHNYSAVYRIKPGDGLENGEIYAGSTEPGYVDGPRLDARFEQAYRIKFGPGNNLFVEDNWLLRRISPDGIVSTFNDFESIHLFINYMAIDLCGNLVICGGSKILRITMGKQTSTIASGNAATLTGKVPASICRLATATIPIIVQSKPTLPFIGDKVVSGCATLADYTIQVSATDNCPTPTITYTQSPAPGTPFTTTTPIDVTITATDNTGGTDSKTFKVTNTSIGAVTPTVTVTSVSGPVCEGEPASFHATVTDGDAGTSYQWQVNGLNAGTNSADFVSSTLHNNDMVNCIVTTGGGCGVPNPAGGGGVPVTINPKPVITLNPAETIFAGKGVTLNPAVTGTVVSYSWEPALGLNDANSQFPTASPETTTTYKLTATSDQGCPAEAFVKITVVNQIIVPNTFTPNADGYNDLWTIKYLDSYTNCTVNVFNRNGGLVFQSKGYISAWTGNSGGKALPTGTYYYIIDLKDGSAPLTGNVAIIR